MPTLKLLSTVIKTKIKALIKALSVFLITHSFFDKIK